MSNEKTSAADLVSEAYSQGISDGHPLNRARGVPEMVEAATKIDASLSELLSALKGFSSRVIGYGASLDHESMRKAWDVADAAIARAEGRS